MACSTTRPERCSFPAVAKKANIRPMKAAYIHKPGPAESIVYGELPKVSRGASYRRGKYRTGWGPPPHSTAERALDELPATVERLCSLLA